MIVLSSVDFGKKIFLPGELEKRFTGGGDSTRFFRDHFYFILHAFDRRNEI